VKFSYLAARVATFVALAIFPWRAEGEDWDVFEPVDETACALLAKADDLNDLDSIDPGRKYLERAAVGKFDFKGPADKVPFRPGCGEIWVAGCPNALHGLRWIKIRPGTCTAVLGGLDEAPSAATGKITSLSADTEAAISLGKADGSETNAEKNPSSADNTNTQNTASTSNPTLPECPKPVAEIQPQPVTQHMADAAKGIPGLNDDFHRHNHYANIEGARSGTTDQEGGENILSQANASAAVKRDSDSLEKLFVSIAGTSISNEALAAVAVVAQNGFQRDITALLQVTGVHDKIHFFKDAGSLNLAQQRATLIERKKQIALGSALEEVRARLEAEKMPDDAKIVEEYIELARQRAANLASTACYLGNFAATNAANDGTLKSLTTAVRKGVGAGPLPETIWDPKSLVSGKGGSGQASATHFENRGVAALPATKSAEDEILEVFGQVNVEMNTVASEPHADPLDQKRGLFEKVHEKYRELDKRNTFPRTFLD
jgi:hypothetical protein